VSFLSLLFRFVGSDEKRLRLRFLSSVLLAWTLSNALLAAVITATNDNSTASSAVNGYMVFLLFSVAGLACEYRVSFFPFVVVGC
jgi:chitin synthase